MDMVVLAFQTDSTRIVTFMVANEGSNHSYPEIGVHGAHHELSHHGGDPEKQASISKINRYHVGLFGEFLKKLRDTKEGNDTLLDSAMIMYGSGIADGDRHNHENLPIILAGRGGGTIPGGRHLRFSARDTLDEPLPGDARPNGRQDAKVQRQHRQAGGITVRLSAARCNPRLTLLKRGTRF